MPNIISQENIRKLWGRIKPFVEEDAGRGGYNCKPCKEAGRVYATRDNGRMCAHFQSLHQDYIAISAMGDI